MGIDEQLNQDETAKIAYDILKNFGPISRTGAIELVRNSLDITILKKGYMPKKHRLKRPQSSNGGCISQHIYRVKMKEYVAPIVQTDRFLSMPVYETLANYYEHLIKKSNHIKTK